MSVINNNTNNHENDRLMQSSSDAANDSAEDSEYWDRLPEESSKAWFAFKTYLHLGPTRSLSKVRRELDKEYGYIKQLEKWSSHYSWVGRARAWDRHIDEARQKEYIGAIKEMAQRQAQLGRELQDKAQEGLQKLDVSALKPADLVKLLDVGAKIERSSWKIKEGLSPVNPVWYANFFNNSEEDDDRDGYIHFEMTPEIEKKMEEIEESFNRHADPGATDAGPWSTPRDMETSKLQCDLLKLIADQHQKECDEEVDD